MLKAASVRPMEWISEVGWRTRVLLRLTSKEAVKLYEQLKVDIVALGRFAMTAANVVIVEVDA